MPESDKTIIEFTAQPDRTLAWHRGGSFRYFVCTVKAPPCEDAEAKAQGLNLALVIDASGSMSGYPLQAAKDTAIEVVNRLQSRDVLSVVSFADESITHLHPRELNDAGRREARNAILSLYTRGRTDLAGGWFQGSREAAEAMNGRPEHHHHVVLLSDGHANQGLLEPDLLATHAGEMRERGVCTSTVGIGEDYSITQLQVLAEAGGGRMHDAQHPHEIAEVVLAELGEVRGTVAEDVRVVLEGPDNTKVDVLESYPLSRKDSDITAALGSMPGSAERTVVWRLRLPAGNPGDEIPIVARCLWKPTGSNKILESEGVPVRFVLAKSAENNGQERDPEVALRVAERWHARVLRDAMTINREGHYERAEEYVSEQVRHFKRYCEGIPGTERLVDELMRTVSRVGYRMQERSRKEVQLWSSKLHRSEQDYRVEERADYSEYLK